MRLGFYVLCQTVPYTHTHTYDRRLNVDDFSISNVKIWNKLISHSAVAERIETRLHSYTIGLVHDLESFRYASPIIIISIKFVSFFKFDVIGLSIFIQFYFCFVFALIKFRCASLVICKLSAGLVFASYQFREMTERHAQRSKEMSKFADYVAIAPKAIICR